MNYYNEWDKPTAAWLQQLINQGLIPNGHIDTRSIADVQPGDLAGYTQCHFFAGIGGWPLALYLAGWPRTRPVWTGSCPCQPFSAAGKRKGQDDERHVWPEFFRLIRECRPDAIIGEQVEGAVGHGWLDGVFADLEGKGYACGAAVLGAHSAGAPHIRQRLYWVADAQGERVTGVCGERYGTQTAIARTRGHEDRQLVELVASSADSGLADATHREAQPAAAVGLHAEPCGGSWLGDSDIQGSQGRPAVPERGDQRASWASSMAIPCADGKSRRVKPGIQLLAHGVPARVVRVRGYGNAIIPQVAAEFIGAYMDVRGISV